MDPIRNGSQPAPPGPANKVALSREEQEAVERLSHDFREAPEEWLPDLADDAAWEQFAHETWAAAETAGLDLTAMSQAAETRALEELAWLESPRASRAGLGEYLQHCRKALALSREELAARIAAFNAQEIASIEAGRAPIYPLVEHREEAVAAWARTVRASLQRITRLLRNCPQPPEWQAAPQAFAMTYIPASADEALETARRYLPPRAQAVIDRLELAAEET